MPNKFLIKFDWDTRVWKSDRFDGDYYRFIHTNISRLKLVSSISNPFGQQLVMMPLAKKGKSDRQDYINQLDIKLILPSEVMGEIERDRQLIVSYPKGNAIVIPDLCRYFALIQQDSSDRLPTWVSVVIK